jgi:hypothetical protein
MQRAGKMYTESTAQIWHIFSWLAPHHVVLHTLHEVKYAFLGRGVNIQSRLELLPARGMSDGSDSMCTTYVLTSSQIAHLQIQVRYYALWETKVCK